MLQIFLFLILMVRSDKNVYPNRLIEESAWDCLNGFGCFKGLMNPKKTPNEAVPIKPKETTNEEECKIDKFRSKIRKCPKHYNSAFQEKNFIAKGGYGRVYNMPSYDSVMKFMNVKQYKFREWNALEYEVRTLEKLKEKNIDLTFQTICFLEDNIIAISLKVPFHCNNESVRPDQ